MPCSTAQSGIAGERGHSKLPAGHPWLGFRDESGPGARLTASMFITVLSSVLVLAHLYGGHTWPSQYIVEAAQPCCP